MKPLKKHPKQQKNIAIVIQEMINECRKEYRKPTCVKLSGKDYKKLLAYLETIVKIPDGGKYDVVFSGIVYRPKTLPKKIDSFMGLPVEKGDITMVTWL